MIYINRNVKNLGNMVLVTDFDKTLTNSESSSTIGVFSKFLSPDYVEKKEKINIRETEIYESNSLSKIELEIKRIWLMKLKLLSQYLTNEIIQEIVRSKEFAFRDEAIEVLQYLTNHNIPVVINSSGVGELIRELLAYNGCNIEKINIFSNFILENQRYFITPENKTLPIIEKSLIRKQQKIIVGDTLGDLTMVSCKKDIDISIGFLDDDYEKFLKQFNENFDLVATENTSYAEPLKKIKVL